MPCQNEPVDETSVGANSGIVRRDLELPCFVARDDFSRREFRNREAALIFGKFSCTAEAAVGANSGIVRRIIVTRLTAGVIACLSRREFRNREAVRNCDTLYLLEIQLQSARIQES